MGVDCPERGAFGITLAECAEEAQHLRLKFQKLPVLLPRRNLANDGVVLLRKHREEKLTFGHYFNFCLDQFVLNV